MRMTVCILGACLLAGCHSSEDLDIGQVDTDAIYQKYEVTYDGQEDETTWYARFRAGGSRGTNLELTGTSSVRCNDAELSPKALLGRYYGSKKPGFTAVHQFVFTEPGGKQFKNSVQLLRADFVEDMPGEISRSEVHQFRFAGPPLIEGETIVLSTANSAELKKLEEDPALHDTSHKLGRSNEAGAIGVEVTPEAFKEMNNGPIFVRWKRTTKRDLEEETPEGGERLGAFYSELREITLTD